MARDAPRLRVTEKRRMIRTHRETGCPKLDRRRICQALVIAVITFIATVGAFANDSTARVGAGGIEFLVNEDIRMVEEVLEISPSRVRVTYRFLNESDRDIHTKVAFPIPAYDPIVSSLVSIADPNSILSSFTVRVNGASVETRGVRRAYVKDRDITDQLRKMGLSDKEIFFEVSDVDFQAFMDKLEGVKKKIGGWWWIRLTVLWDMTFPAKKELIVEHDYTPATGSGWAMSHTGQSREDLKLSTDALWNSFTGKTDPYEDCLDDAAKKAIDNKVRKAASRTPDSVTVSYHSVEYILGTGRNWKGPIGDFTLRVKKAKPDQVVSLCFPGEPKKIGSTVYEFHQKDFVPPDKLVVYFYTVGSEVPDTNNP